MPQGHCVASQPVFFEEKNPPGAGDGIVVPAGHTLPGVQDLHPADVVIEELELYVPAAHCLQAELPIALA